MDGHTDAYTHHCPLSVVAVADPEDLSPPLIDTPTGGPPAEDHETAHPQTEAPPSAAPSTRAVLEELKASSVRPNSVQLQWSVPEGHFDSFMLQYQDVHGQPQALPIDGRLRLVTVPGLSPSQRYRFHLYGLQGGRKTDHVSTDVITADGEGQRTETAAVSEELPLPSEEPQDEQHETKAPPSATTPARAVLKDLRVSSVSPDSVQLQWSVPEAPFDSFTLQYRDAHGQPQALPIDGGSRSVTVPGLSPSSRYRFHLYGMRGRKRVYHTSTEAVTGEGDAPLPHPHPRDCAEEQLNGPGPSRETLIFLRGDPARPLRVFCDMETDGGGWLVFQRRQDGSTDFWRGWESYARGFGNISGEFWLGNEALHELTTATRTELRIDLRTGRDSAFALYRDFAVGSAEERYRLRVGAFSGTAGDALSYHSGSPFSTRDRDFRDPRDPWWYRNCHYANLNGRYGTPRDHQGIHWFPWKGFNVSIPFTEMKLRPQRG
uniref:Tenascin XB n=1 Tax=Taeniopygia guttata TaxID=59729 RepID=A0A674GJ27_TAEGU